MIVALDEWADAAIAPPKSNYPTRRRTARSSAVEDSRAAFPDPGRECPHRRERAALPDFGPKFTSDRRLRHPAAADDSGRATRCVVPKTDRGRTRSRRASDGGQSSAPVGTITGWNVAAAGPQGRRSLRAERRVRPVCEDQSRAGGQRSDPRAVARGTLREQGRIRPAVVDDAARRLVKERFLLQEDADRYMQAAREADALFTRATGNQMQRTES